MTKKKPKVQGKRVQDPVQSIELIVRATAGAVSYRIENDTIYILGPHGFILKAVKKEKV